MHTRNMKVGDDVDLRSIAEETELFTGAELEGLCREAGIVALREDISATVVCNRHFQTVKGSLKPALTKEEIDSYSSFMKSSGRFESSTSGSKSKKKTVVPFFSVKSCVVSIAVLAAAKYFSMHARQTSNELVVT